MKLILSTLAALVALTFTSVSANAAGAGLTNGWVGGDGGLSVPTYHDTSARGLWGFTAGAKLGGEWGLGAYFQHSSAHEDLDQQTNVSFNYDLYGIQGSYHFEGDALGAYFGLRVGISKVKEGSIETSPVNYGIFAGYDYFFNHHISLGGEASVMAVGSGEDQGQHIGAFAMIDFVGALKFWF